MTEEKITQCGKPDQIAPLFERSRQLIRRSQAIVEQTTKLLEQSGKLLSPSRKVSAEDLTPIPATKGKDPRPLSRTGGK
jgi:hypothetical protein